MLGQVASNESTDMSQSERPHILHDKDFKPVAYVAVHGIEAKRDKRTKLLPCGIGLALIYFDQHRLFVGAGLFKDTQDCFAEAVIQGINEANRRIADEAKGDFDFLVSVREDIELAELFVIQGRRPDSLGSRRRCGRRKTALATMAQTASLSHKRSSPLSSWRAREEAKPTAARPMSNIVQVEASGIGGREFPIPALSAIEYPSRTVNI